MSSDDRLVEKLRDRWLRELDGRTPEVPRVSVPLAALSRLCVLLGRAEGLAAGTGIALAQDGKWEWGRHLQEDAERVAGEVRGLFD